MGQTNDKRILKSLLALTEGTPFTTFAGISGSTAASDIAVTGDYSSISQEFALLPPADEIWYITRMSLYIRTLGKVRIDKYGDGNAVANGIGLQLRTGGSIGPLVSDFNGNPAARCKDNSDWQMHLCRFTTGDFDTGGGGDLVSGIWECDAALGRAIILDPRRGDALIVFAEDDFTFLTDHKFKFGGYKNAIPGIGL